MRAVADPTLDLPGYVTVPWFSENLLTWLPQHRGVSRSSCTHGPRAPRLRRCLPPATCLCSGCGDEPARAGRFCRTKATTTDVLSDASARWTSVVGARGSGLFPVHGRRLCAVSSLGGQGWGLPAPSFQGPGPIHPGRPWAVMEPKSARTHTPALGLDLHRTTGDLRLQSSAPSAGARADHPVVPVSHGPQHGQSRASCVAFPTTSVLDDEPALSREDLTDGVIDVLLGHAPFQVLWPRVRGQICARRRWAVPLRARLGPRVSIHEAGLLLTPPSTEGGPGPPPRADGSFVLDERKRGALHVGTAPTGCRSHATGTQDRKPALCTLGPHDTNGSSALLAPALTRAETPTGKHRQTSCERARSPRRQAPPPEAVLAAAHV